MNQMMDSSLFADRVKKQIFAIGKCCNVNSLTTCGPWMSPFCLKCTIHLKMNKIEHKRENGGSEWKQVNGQFMINRKYRLMVLPSL